MLIKQFQIQILKIEKVLHFVVNDVVNRQLFFSWVVNVLIEFVIQISGK